VQLGWTVAFDSRKCNIIARALEAISITAVTRALDALPRNSAKDLASTSMHCAYYERVVIREIILFIGKPKRRSRMISNVGCHYS